MKWVKGMPTKPGWYFVRRTGWRMLCLEFTERDGAIEPEYGPRDGWEEHAGPVPVPCDSLAGTVLWRLFFNQRTKEIKFETTGNQCRDKYIAGLKFRKMLKVRRLPKNSRLAFQGYVRGEP